MPLFGPNIKKMQEEKDIQGLVRCLTGGNPQVRLEATRALGAVANLEGLGQALSNDNLGVRVEASKLMKGLGTDGFRLLAQSLVDELRLGKPEDKMEALIIMQGRAPKYLFVSSVVSLEAAELFTKVELGDRIPLEFVATGLRYGLLEEADILVGWFIIVTLVELGDRSPGWPKTLVDVAQAYLGWSKESGPGAAGDMLGLAFVESTVREETMRALSCFGESDLAFRVLADEASGKPTLVGFQKPKNNPLLAICALGALGRQEAQPLLQRLASRGEEGEKKAALVSLELLGTASYDEIASKAL